MLTQSLRSDPERRLLVVQRCTTDSCQSKQEEIVSALELSSDRSEQIVVLPGSVKELLTSEDLTQKLLELIPPSQDVPF
jgi:hypothetical protein